MLLKHSIVLKVVGTLQLTPQKDARSLYKYIKFGIELNLLFVCFSFALHCHH